MPVNFSVADLVKEIKDMSGFFAARVAIVGATDDDVAKGMISSFAKKVASLMGFDAAMALQLTTALSDSSMTAPLKRVVQTAIDQRLSGHAAESGSRLLDAYKPQRLTSSITSYLTAADWLALKSDKVTAQTQMGVIASRFARLGLRYAHEQTVKWSVAVLAVLMTESSGQYPQYSFLYNQVQEFKALMESIRRPAVLPHLLEYPASPADLSKDMFDHAYDEGDGPVQVELDRLAVCAAQHIPLRSNSNLLKAPSAPTSNVTWEGLQRFIASQSAAPAGLTIMSPPRLTFPAAQPSGLPQLTHSAAQPSVLPQLTHSADQPSGLPQLTQSAAQPSGLPEPTQSAAQPPSGSGMLAIEAPSAQTVAAPAASAAVQMLSFQPRARKVHAMAAKPEAKPEDEDDVGGESLDNNDAEPANVTAETGKGNRLPAEAFEDAAFAALVSRDCRKKPAKAAAQAATTPTADAVKATDKATAHAAKAAAKATAKATAHAAKAAAKAKAKATAEAAKAAAKANAKAPAEACDTAREKGKRPLQLGCSKCRGSPKGCTQCRSDAFSGKRFTKGL